MVLTGAVLGLAVVMLVLVREAQVTVAERLAGPVWSTPGRVYSGAIEVWPGLSLTPDALAEDLRAAGYTPVDRLEGVGEYQRTADAVVVNNPPHAGRPGSLAGRSGEGTEVLVTFRNGRVASVSPSERARFAPAVLATLAGPSAERRDPVPLEEIPRHLVQAVLVMEDRDFYEHPGLSAVGVLRALVANLLAGRTVQGGSTLTQQLAKNLFLSPERTFARKTREALLAFALERAATKDEILALYLDGVYLGQVGGQAIHGVAEASRVYFGKPAQRLSLGEAALLAGIIPAPNTWHPLRHPERARERRDLVLEQMARFGAVSPEDAEAARKADPVTRPTAVHRTAVWGVDLAVERVEAELGRGRVIREGLEVWTTLSPPLQRLAEQAVGEGLQEVIRDHPSAAGVQVALVVLDARNGAILASVGGRDYAESSFDRAVQARRQVGSLVKPLTLLAALEADRKLTLATRLPDEPLTRTVGGRTWRPSNYDGVYRGRVSVRETVVHSRNIPAIHLAERVGMARLQKFLHELGLEDASRYPSVALGAFEASPLEVAGAYTVFPRGGSLARPWLLRAVTDLQGRSLYAEEAQSRQVSSSRSAALAGRTLEAVIRRGTGRGAARHGVRRGAGGKTGTTDRGRDAWFAGYSSQLVAVVWVGHDRGRAHGLAGSQAALPVWARFMAASGTLGDDPSGGAELVEVELCAESLAPATDRCPETRVESFAPDQVPEGTCPLHGGTGVAGSGDEGGAQGEGTRRDRRGLIARIRNAFSRQGDAAEGE